MVKNPFFRESNLFSDRETLTQVQPKNFFTVLHAPEFVLAKTMMSNILPVVCFSNCLLLSIIFLVSLRKLRVLLKSSTRMGKIKLALNVKLIKKKASWEIFLCRRIQ